MDNNHVDITWVEARELDKALAKDYIMTSFARERPDSLPPEKRGSLEPFTEAAIQELFIPGPTAQPDEPVTHPLWWINKTLRRAMDQHFSELQTAVRDTVAMPQIPADKRTIQTQLLRSARDALNRGM